MCMPSGYQARLLSPQIDVAGPKSTNCTFQFWYHMYGVGIGTLNVHVKSTDQLAIMCMDQ